MSWNYIHTPQLPLGGGNSVLNFYRPRTKKRRWGSRGAVSSPSSTAGWVGGMSEGFQAAGRLGELGGSQPRHPESASLALANRHLADTGIGLRLSIHYAGCRTQSMPGRGAVVQYLPPPIARSLGAGGGVGFPRRRLDGEKVGSPSKRHSSEGLLASGEKPLPSPGLWVSEPFRVSLGALATATALSRGRPVAGSRVGCPVRTGRKQLQPFSPPENHPLVLGCSGSFPRGDGAEKLPRMAAVFSLPGGALDSRAKDNGAKWVSLSRPAFRNGGEAPGAFCSG